MRVWNVSFNFFKNREIYGPLCIGFDPSHKVLQSWNLSCDYKGLKDFCDILLTAVVGNVGIIKPQVAFFELYGLEGLQVLKELIENAQEQGLLVIADAKRGDIGSTVEAYGQAWLGSSSPFKADAITANAFLGFDALIPLIKIAEETGTAVLWLFNPRIRRESKCAMRLLVIKHFLFIWHSVFVTIIASLWKRIILLVPLVRLLEEHSAVKQKIQSNS